MSHLPAIYSRKGSWQLTQEMFACGVCVGHNAFPHHVFILLDETDQFVYTIMAPHCSYYLPTAQLSIISTFSQRDVTTLFFISVGLSSAHTSPFQTLRHLVLKIVRNTKYSVYQEYLGSYWVRWMQAGLAWLIQSSYTTMTTNEQGTYTSLPQ
jgi:hypothetical protein